MEEECPNCHAPIPAGSKFCPVCGAALKFNSQEQINRTPSNPINTSMTPKMAVPISPQLQTQPATPIGKCAWCGKEIINPRVEEVRMQSKYGMRNFRFKVIICPVCGYSHFFILN